MLTETELQTRAAQMVDREVNCCLSYLVATLAQGYPAIHPDRGDGGLVNLSEQAIDLAAPIDDYEEAAIQAGFDLRVTDGRWWRLEDPTDDFATAQDACETLNIEPYQWEVYEHWAVSQWLADKLTQKGEKVDNDFAGLCVWARTTTGQAISMDGVIRAIVTEMVEAV